MLEYYLKELDYLNKPDFLNKYLKVPSLIRLKNISYFCGMDYASKDIYDFKEKITRYDHSLTVALLTWRLTHDKIMTLAGLFHDVGTPCFSHVIDYMNKDYLNQESTEEYTEKILLQDELLNRYFKEDNIDINDIVNFKDYSIVDNKRPKVCADRLDGVILTGSFWTKEISKDDISLILDDLTVYQNEEHEPEIGFKTKKIAEKVLKKSEKIDIYCHSKEDNYMMELLAKITKYGIDNGYFTYKDLYIYNEDDLYSLLKSKSDKTLKEYLRIFETVKKENIPDIQMPNIKIRDLNPLVNGERLGEK